MHRWDMLAAIRIRSWPSISLDEGCSNDISLSWHASDLLGFVLLLYAMQKTDPLSKRGKKASRIRVRSQNLYWGKEWRWWSRRQWATGRCYAWARIDTIARFQQHKRVADEEDWHSLASSQETQAVEGTERLVKRFGPFSCVLKQFRRKKWHNSSLHQPKQSSIIVKP